MGVMGKQDIGPCYVRTGRAISQHNLYRHVISSRFHLQSILCPPKVDVIQSRVSRIQLARSAIFVDFVATKILENMVPFWRRPAHL